MKRKTMTDRQQQIYNTICDFYEKNLYPPSYRDIAAIYDMTPKGAHDHVTAMKSKGWILDCGHIVPADTVISFDDYEIEQVDGMQND